MAGQELASRTPHSLRCRICNWLDWLERMRRVGGGYVCRDLRHCLDRSPVKETT